MAIALGPLKQCHGSGTISKLHVYYYTSITSTEQKAIATQSAYLG